MRNADYEVDAVLYRFNQVGDTLYTKRISITRFEKFYLPKKLQMVGGMLQVKHPAWEIPCRMFL